MNAQVFLQFTNSDGAFFPPQYFDAVFPPNAYFYQVNKPNPSVDTWDFWWGTTQLLSVTGLAWTANRHDAFAEEQNFSGDQTPGDTTAHATFRDIMWSDFANWQFSSFGTPGNPYVAGEPIDPALPDRGLAGFDALTAIDGGNFDTWDARCPP